MDRKSFKIDPNSTSTYAGNDIEGLTDFSFTQEATETTLGTDGKPYLTGSFIGDISYVITVNGVDCSTSISAGDVGTLIMKAIEQINGNGSINPTKLYTFSNAVCTGKTGSINHIGNSVSTLTFRSVSSNGTVDPLAIS